MTAARTITVQDVYSETHQIVQGWGKILREKTRWCVEYTVSRPGYIDFHYRRSFRTEAEARVYAAELTPSAAGLPGIEP